MNSKRYMERELEQQSQLEQQCQRRLAALPQGKLQLVTVKGKKYYRRLDSGAYIYVGKSDRSDIQQLQHRKYWEMMLKNVRVNQKLIKDYLQYQRSTDPAEVMACLPKTYQCEIGSIFPEAEDFERWAAAPYDKSNARPEKLRHKTLKGDLVRSKSEALIANMLYDQRIPYHYEENLALKQELIAPDFKIAVRTEKRFKLLEHCGMVGDEFYRERFKRKLTLYLLNGYIPWRDVFFTFDDTDGAIDTEAIQQMIENYFF